MICENKKIETEIGRRSRLCYGRVARRKTKSAPRDKLPKDAFAVLMKNAVKQYAARTAAIMRDTPA
jgi:hypothetical protein